MAKHDEEGPQEVSHESVARRRIRDRRSEEQLDFEIEFYNRVLETQPDYVHVLRAYGNCLSAKGLYSRGVQVDRQLVQLRPHDPVVHYNLACSYSMLRKTEAAIAELDSALGLGYFDFDHLLRDPDLEHVRRDARFLGLLGRHLKRARRARLSR